jgi:hypothetical protein
MTVLGRDGCTVLACRTMSLGMHPPYLPLVGAVPCVQTVELPVPRPRHHDVRILVRLAVDTGRVERRVIKGACGPLQQVSYAGEWLPHLTRTAINSAVGAPHGLIPSTI